MSLRTRVTVLVAVLALAGCQPVGGEATVLNESGRDDLTLVWVTAQGRDPWSYELDDSMSFDTQFMDRELQCYLPDEGRLEIRSARDGVVAVHLFADRPVCDGDVMVLGRDGALTWREGGWAWA